MTASDIIRAGPVVRARPWPRHALSSGAWREMARALKLQPELRFQALWADAEQVYALFTRPDPLFVSAPIEAGLYAALSPARPEAVLFERAVNDLWGHLAADSADPRPLLDHGTWPVLQPLQPRPAPNAGAPEPVELRGAPPGSIRFQSGPISPGGPALLGVAAQGERVTAVDSRLGYAHRGILLLLRGKTPAEAAVLVARLSGEGTVAHSLAFARAIEAATGAEPPPRAIAIRGLLADLERIAIGLHDIAEALDAAGRNAAPVRAGREELLRACQLAFRHRLLMDRVIPGGVASDITPSGIQALTDPLARLALRDHRLPCLEPRIAALREAVDTLLTRPRTLPEGALLSAVPVGTGEGVGRAEGPRGTHWHWAQLRDGRIVQAFTGDPGFLLWPRFGSAVVGAPLAEVPVLRRAMGLSPAGVDG